MSESLVRPVIEPNAQIFHGIASIPAENMHTEPQLIAEAPVDASRSYELQHRSAETVNLLERFTRSRLIRKIGAAATALTVTLTGVAVEASPAAAHSQEYTITDAAIGGYFSRNSPHTKDTPRIDGKGVYPGDRVRLICGVTDGDPFSNEPDESHNTTWHKIINLTRPEQGESWENDHLFDTPNKANELAPGEANCNTLSNAGQSPEERKTNVKACYFNIKAPSKNLTFSYNGKNDGAYYGNAWQAAKNWSDLGTGITIKPTNGDNAYIKFQDVDVSAPWLAWTDIPTGAEFLGPHKTVPSDPFVPNSVTILINKRQMNKLKLEEKGDFKRTYTLTHEIGHTLGLAHPDEFCEQSAATIMNKGSEKTIFTEGFNTPRIFDKLELEQLYE